MSLADLDGHGGLDWGYNAHGVMLWSVALPDGELHVVREYSFRQMTAEAVGAQIHRITKDLGMRRLVSIAADPAIWQKTGAGRGESIAETLLRLRLPLRKADNDRKLGWLRMHEYFRPKPDGSGPWLTIDPSCTGLIRTIPMMIQDSHDPDDMDTTGQDHWCDACFVAGTRITTLRGEVPIEQVTLSDLILTRHGYQPVDAVFCVGERPVAQLTAGACHLIGTADHNIYANDTWVPLGSLRYGDMIVTCPRTPITTGAEPDVSGSRLDTPSLAGGISTTAMATPRTMRSRIWNASRQWSMRLVTVLQCSAAAVRSVIARMRHAGEVDSVPITASHSGAVAWNSTTWLSVVAPARSRSDRTATITRWPVHASAQGLAPTLGRAPNSCAQDVGSPLWPILPAPNFVPAPVASVLHVGHAHVYNLTVRHVHEYFAEGILVANCRYLLMSRASPTRLDKAPEPYPVGSWGHATAWHDAQSVKDAVLG